MSAITAVASRPAPAPVTPASCPLCRGADASIVARDIGDYEYGTPGAWRWLRCSGCGLVRLDPMPDGAVLDRAYPPHYHAYVAPRSALTRRLIAMSGARAASAMARLVPPGGTVLDVGCGTGALLERIGRRSAGRCRLLGVEYKPEAAEAARRRGIETWTGELAGAGIPAGSVDLAILQHVLEHVRDPIDTLRDILRLLRPGARLVGELPNFASWDARLFGRLWGGGHAPRHLWHFEPATLRLALQDAGFVGVTIAPALHTGHWAGSIQHWIRRGRRDERGLTAGRAWYYPALLLVAVPINAVQVGLNRSGVMRFQARRPEARP